ncbi:MAG: hypothetical protein ABW199_01875 [Caulobacterales bacterium]
MSDDKPAKNPQEMSLKERKEAAHQEKRAGDGELLESGQEEVFSRSEIERGVDEHKSEAGGKPQSGS